MIREEWPPQRAIQPSEGSTAECKATKELFKAAVDNTDRLYVVLEMFEFRKALNICAWISRFVQNLRYPNQKVSGPLITEEIQEQHLLWVKRAQQSCEFEEDLLRLNLQPNPDGVLECRGRLQGLYPVHLHISIPRSWCTVNICALYAGEWV